MNSDLTQTDGVLSTDNPQGASSPAGASKASDFQQAAGLESLNQNKSLTVADNGQRIVQPKPVANATFSTYIIIFVGAVVFFVVCKRLIIWVKAAPSASVASEPVVVLTESKSKKPKKQSRSKRRQTK